MINFIRVDHRLLHGQVIYSWLKSIECDTIFVINDEVANNEARKNALRMVKPADKKLVMKSVDDAIKSVESGITDKYKMFVIFSNISDLTKFVLSLDNIKSVNLGGTLSTKDSKMYFPQINLEDNDVNNLKKLIEKGIEVECRLVPSDTKIIVNKKWEE